MTPPRRRFERKDGDVPSALPRGRAALPPDIVRESQRRRLLAAMTELAATKGFADLTITDLVERAGVGRKSFYEIFTDKTDCYLAGYTLNADFLLARFSQALWAEPDPADGLVEAMRAYVQTLSVKPLHARAYLLESVRAGAEAMARRWQTLLAFVEVTQAGYQRALEAHPELEPVSESTVVALIGGVNELACRVLDRRGGDGEVTVLEADVVHLTTTLLGLDDVLTPKEAVL
jgi:AcrR family transcriptional regulator